MTLFRDHFSKQADLYAKYRPHYPAELFGYLAKLAPERELAWDCGTGNGQAAIGLAQYFNRIVATDPSAQQIANCFAHDKVEYKVEKAERTSLPDASADLVTVANALHWFSFAEFYREVERVTKPGGVLAAWTYSLLTVSPAVDEVVQELHDGLLGDYWLHKNRLVSNGYKDIPFPFEQLDDPVFYSTKHMGLDDLDGYLHTWSAVQRYLLEKGSDPVQKLFPALAKAWGQPGEQKEVKWRLILLAGRVS